MPVNRFYCEETLENKSNVTIAGAEHHHLAHVVRKGAGDSVELVDGKGRLAQAEIIAVTRQEASLQIHEVQSFPPPKEHIILAQAIPKMNRLETILEKATELGMTELWLFPAAKCDRKNLSSKALDKMHRITVNALKQSGRFFLPSISIKSDLFQWGQWTAPYFLGI